jgi:hypothetical protein
MKTKKGKKVNESLATKIALLEAIISSGKNNLDEEKNDLHPIDGSKNNDKNSNNSLEIKNEGEKFNGLLPVEAMTAIKGINCKNDEPTSSRQNSIDYSVSPNRFFSKKVVTQSGNLSFKGNIIYFLIKIGKVISISLAKRVAMLERLFNSSSSTGESSIYESKLDHSNLERPSMPPKRKKNTKKIQNFP